METMVHLTMITSSLMNLLGERRPITQAQYDDQNYTINSSGQ